MYRRDYINYIMFYQKKKQVANRNAKIQIKVKLINFNRF